MSSYDPSQPQTAAPASPQSYPSDPTDPQAYAAAPQQWEKPVPTGTTLASVNAFAILSIIFAFSVPLMAIIFGHMGLSQIKRTGDSGKGIALTGTIIGYVSFAAIAVFLILYLTFIGLMIGAAAEFGNSAF